MNIFESIKIIRDYRKDPIGYVTQLFRKNGHRSVLSVFGKKLIMISHPNDILHVLKENHGAYSKGRTTKKLRAFMGNGLITSEGEFWRKQHRMIRPIMNLKSTISFGPKIFETTQDFLSSFRIQSQVDGLKEMNRLAWRIVLQTLFSQKANAEMDQWLDDVLFMMETVTERTRSIIPIPFWVPTPKHQRFHRAVKILNNYIYSLIKERETGEKKKDLLQLLIDTQEDDSDSSRMGHKEIKDEILTFLMAGHETITNSLSWTLITLAQNPSCLEKLREESDIFFLNKDYEELNSMPFMGAVIEEVMRLWPPVWAFMRQAEKEDQLGNVKVPKGANIVTLPFISHRAPDFWKDPLSFRPERFLADEKKKIPVGAYYPFGLGPRACIGAYFAGLEARIVLSSLIHHFEWEIINEAEQTYEAGITLRPTNNIVMRFKARSC